MLPITSYTDAIGNPRQLSPLLGDLHPDPAREPQSKAGLVILPLVGRNREWTLSLPTASYFSLPPSDIALRCRHTSPLFARAEYIPDALIVFDNLGAPHTLPALLQEAHTPIEEFIRLNCSAKRRNRIRMALESIAAATASPIGHGALNKGRICFDEGCNLRLGDRPLIAEPVRNDHIALGKASLLLFVAASDLKAYRALSAEPHSSKDEEQRRLRCLLSAAEYHGSTALATLCSALLNGASEQHIATAIRGLAHEPFASLEILHPLLTSRGANHFPIATTTAPLPTEEFARVDFDLCERVEMAGDQIVRYLRGGRWGYCHHDGQMIKVEREIIAAYDFQEGRAVIRTPRGYGLVDTTGRLVMNDVWEQLCWYGDENVAVGADYQGHWHIYDRQGRQLSAVACDWMGDASEGFVVARRNGRFGYYSTDGRRHTDFIYQEAFSFSDGLALVRRNEGPYFHIDTSFHRVVE